MPSQTVMWTAVPNGVEGNRARLVCVVSPRLAGDGTLTVSSFPDWLNWAERAAKVTFRVQFDARTPVTADRVSPPPEARRWTALVSKDLTVRPFTFIDHSTHRIRSYPAGHVADFLRDHYTKVAAASPTQFPTIGDHIDGLAQIGFSAPPESYEPTVRRGIESWLGLRRMVPPAAGPQPMSDFLQATMFHEVPRNAPRAAPQAVRPDFHQLLSLLNQYPDLQRRLGLVFDLTVPLSDAAGASTVRVQPQWSAALTGTTTVTPATRMIVFADRFSPAPKNGSDLDRDMLRLRQSDYRVLTLDADGAALKARHFADNMISVHWRRNAPDTAARASLPAMRSAGLAVVRTGRAGQLLERFDDAAALESALQGGKPVTLDADALLQGLRWAVYDVASRRWYSLCERRGRYLFLRDRSLDLQLTDAGPVSTAVTQRTDAADGDYYLSEVVCRWEGQSLVAQRPGRSLDRDPARAPGSPPNDPPPEIPLQVDFVPEPGTLAPLRYGRTYRLRAYASYVGGAGRRFDPADTAVDTEQATAEVTYARLEPVPPPVVVMRRPNAPGESLHHLVIHSDVDTPAANVEPTERHILPPKAAQELAEAHGLFDTPTGLDRAAYATITARGNGTLAVGGRPDPADHGQRYYDVDTLRFPVENGQTAAVPWLVDPIARGAALHDLPRGASSHQVDFGYGTGATWRTPRPFRVRLVEGRGAPSFDPNTRLLTVRLLKGEVGEARLSATPHLDDLNLMEIWRWLRESVTAAQLSNHRDHALAGRHWLLTPAQPLTFVHAVRRPLVAPTIGDPVTLRTVGSTAARLRANLGISRMSTVSVDVRAQWTDPVDALDDTGWQPRRMVTRGAELGAVQVPPSGASAPETNMDIQVPHELGDTATHVVEYTVVAKSRFAEYFTRRHTVTVTLTGTQWQTVDATGVVPQSEVVTRNGTTHRRDADYDIDTDGGRIRRRDGSSVPAGTAVEVSFLPSVSRASLTAKVPVRSSARPAPPKPLYVVPTFTWSNPHSATEVTSMRRGGGLRVYLDRPWWSSGDDERLAVVLWNAPAGATDVAEPMRPYVTRWGMDPLYVGAVPPRLVPSAADFPRASIRAAGLRLAEHDAAVTVAAHDVQPDLKRRLWFCDIELSPGFAHQPFVRLALARYQPNALNGVELSPVVLADYAQLASDRTATVVYQDATGHVAVTVTGHSAATSADGQRVSEVELVLERRMPGVPGDLGWAVVGHRQLLTASRLGSGEIQWRGQVKLPVARGTEPMRLVLREFDMLADGRRLTYTDLLPVDGSAPKPSQSPSA